MKVAEALVVGADPARVAHLRDVTNVSPEGLVPYQQEIRAVEEMYRSIWQLHAYIDKEHVAKAALVAQAFEHRLGFPNDGLLEAEYGDGSPDNPYDQLAQVIEDKVGRAYHQNVIGRLDQVITERLRHGKEAEAIDGMVSRAINTVLKEVGDAAQPEPGEQLGFGPLIKDKA